ncbi:MAG TPA: ArgE/DapE family deacylase [Solirubrobacteraceae bacterium]|nr:ArgE/DapE family deacylase [Solirubrobacteraceae bacterium]
MTALASELTEKVLSAVNDQRGELIAAISKAVQIPSVNPRYPGQVYEDIVGGEGEVSRFVAGIYRELGAEVDVFGLEPGRENAVGLIRGSGGGRSLICNGHVDVVPAGSVSNWRHDPFSGLIDGDRIWGRGSTDMKAGVLAQAFAARALKQSGVQLRGDLILEAVVGEECMNNDIGVSATVERGYRADAAVVAEPTTGTRALAVMPTSPGQLWFTLTVQGKVTHAANRGQTLHPSGTGAPPGVSAIDKGLVILDGLRRLEQQWAFSKRHPLYRPGQFTIMPGILEAGTSGVQFPLFVPEHMRTEYLVWYPPDDDPDEVKAQIEDHVRQIAATDDWLREHEPRIDWRLHWPANSPASDAITEAMISAHERAADDTRFAGAAEVAGFPAVDDASWLTLAGIPAISYGPGDLAVAHADDEFVRIDEVICATRAFALLAMEWCGVAGTGT